MPTNVNRQWEILIDDTLPKDGVKSTNYRTILKGEGFKQLKLQFNVVIDFGGAVSYADLRFFNLNDKTRNILMKKESAISIIAGYQDNKDVIFTGKIKNSFRDGLPPNIFLRVLCVGGSQPESQKKPILIALGKPAKTIDIIKQCATSLGYPTIIDSNMPPMFADYIKGNTLIGSPRQILDDIAHDRKFNWIVAGDKVVIVPAGSFRKGIPHKVSWETGMVGIPEMSEVGTDVTVRLNPKIRIGGQIDVESKRSTFNFGSLYYEDIPASQGSGIFTVQRLNHVGDTHGDTWNTQVNGFRKLGYLGMPT